MTAVLRVLLWLLCGMAGLALPAGAATTLHLDPDAAEVDAWPALTVLSDPSTTLDLAAVLERRAEFRAPQGPRNNFGVRHDALWLHLPLQSAGGSGRWVMEVDYPALNRIDAYLLRDGRVVARHRLGNELPFDQRPMRTRAHALSLDLPPGVPHELLLRVASTSSMIVPITLYRADDFLTHESARQLLQGLMMGVTLALLAYSALHGFSLRDPLFAQYALMLLGVGTFFVSYTGIGQQHVWNEQTGLLARIAPIAVLAGIAGGCWFFTGALGTRRDAPRVGRALDLTSVAALLAIGLSLCDLIDYRHTQLAATVLGPIPIVVAVRFALHRARQGDHMAQWMVVGWGAYTAGALSMAALLRGWLPADFWTQHLFQATSMVEMLAWVRVLGLRIEGIRRAAERGETERQALHSLAHTDALTGLPNRRGLSQALDQALQVRPPGRMVAVYLLDLDGFKAVNDRLGHDAGDELLRQVAQRLRAQLRDSDVVARLGGDEFVVVATDLADDAAADQIGDQLIQAVEAPFEVDGQGCHVGLTAGLAVAPADGSLAAVLLHKADEAMYAGKQSGRHCLRRTAPAIAAAGGAPAVGREGVAPQPDAAVGSSSASASA